MNSYLELRRARWLEKISHMKSNRIPRLLLGAWIQHPRRNGQAGRSQQTNRHGYVHTLNTLGFSGNFLFSDWMTEARNRNIWSKRVEEFLYLPEGTYNRTNAVHSAAKLKNYDSDSD